MSTDPHREAIMHRAGAPLSEAHAALVLLHGRGDSAHGILGLAGGIERGDLAVLAPGAVGSSWYPNSFLAPLSANEPFLASALGAVQRCVDAANVAGIPASRIAIAGFSQGACLALEFVARSGFPAGLVVGLSGGLIGTDEAEADAGTLVGAGGRYADKRFDSSSDLRGTRVILRCSDVDPHIPWQRVDASAQVLRRLGADVDARATPGGGHTVEREGYETFLAAVAAL